LSKNKRPEELTPVFVFAGLFSGVLSGFLKIKIFLAVVFIGGIIDYTNSFAPPILFT